MSVVYEVQISLGVTGEGSRGGVKQIVKKFNRALRNVVLHKKKKGCLLSFKDWNIFRDRNETRSHRAS